MSLGLCPPRFRGWDAFPSPANHCPSLQTPRSPPVPPSIHRQMSSKDLEPSQVLAVGGKAIPAPAYKLLGGRGSEFMLCLNTRRTLRKHLLGTPSTVPFLQVTWDDEQTRGHMQGSFPAGKTGFPSAERCSPTSAFPTPLRNGRPGPSFLNPCSSNSR